MNKTLVCPECCVGTTIPHAWWCKSQENEDLVFIDVYDFIGPTTIITEIK